MLDRCSQFGASSFFEIFGIDVSDSLELHVKRARFSLCSSLGGLKNTSRMAQSDVCTPFAVSLRKPGFVIKQGCLKYFVYEKSMWLVRVVQSLLC
jgi:hypothetical protein